MFVLTFLGIVPFSINAGASLLCPLLFDLAPVVPAAEAERRLRSLAAERGGGEDSALAT